jgi:CubicO group peptidase (beta-lactamase class C family)
MDPIGAAATWEWHGYRNSWVEIDGQRMQSVSGGAHWGGGLWISSRDHARVGQLIINRGTWNGRRILSEDWIEQMTTPSPCNPGYGYLWWLNTDQERFPHAPATSVFALGAGYNAVCVIPEHDLVAVVRWIKQEKIDDLVGLILASLD